MSKFRSFIAVGLLLSNTLASVVAHAEAGPNIEKASQVASTVTHSGPIRVLEITKAGAQYSFYIHRFTQTKVPRVDILGTYPIERFLLAPAAIRSQGLDTQGTIKGATIAAGALVGLLLGVKAKGSIGLFGVAGSSILFLAGGVEAGQYFSDVHSNTVQQDAASADQMIEQFKKSTESSVFMSITPLQEAQLLQILTAAAK